MKKLAQDIIDEIPKKEIKISKKLKKSEELLEKEQIKQLILEERENNAGLSSQEISIKYGIDKDTAKLYLKEFIENKKKEEEKQKPEQIKPEKKELKFKELIKKFIDKNDKETVEKITMQVILYGLPLNFVVWCLLNLRFNFYSWIGWGLLVWFADKKLINMVRGLWIK